MLKRAGLNPRGVQVLEGIAKVTHPPTKSHSSVQPSLFQAGLVSEVNFSEILPDMAKKNYLCIYTE